MLAFWLEVGWVGSGLVALQRVVLTHMSSSMEFREGAVVGIGMRRSTSRKGNIMSCPESVNSNTE